MLVPSVNAQSTADLQAQIAALLAQIQALQSQLGQTSAPATSYTRDLTVGSTGADVSSLQSMLIAKGFLAIASPTGYFGPMTKTALAAWQASVGITPASGYFGPKTRAYVATSVVTPTTTVVPTTTVLPTTQTEGSLTVEVNPSPAAGTNVYEGDTKVNVLGIKAKATNGDVKIERVKIDLGTATTIYNKILGRLYVTDGSATLGEIALNSSNIVKEGSNHYVTIAGFNFLVKKDETRVLYIAADMYNTIDSVYNNTSHTLTIPQNGVRGVDGLGLSQYGPTSASFSRTFTAKKNLANSAALTMSKNVNSPKVGNIISDNLGDVSGATLLAFDLRSENDRIKVTQFNVTSTWATGGATTLNTLYIYDGSTLVGSASVTAAGLATMSNVEVFVDRDTTKTLTVKGDFRGATTTAFAGTLAINVEGTGATAGATAENSLGDSVTVTGSATSDTLSVFRVAPVFASAPTTSVSFFPGVSGVSTSSITGKFTFTVKAGGNDLYFLNLSTSTVMKIYKSNAVDGSSTTTSKLVSLDSNFQVQSDTAIYKLPKDVTGTITVDFTMNKGNSTGDGLYHFTLEKVGWATTATHSQVYTTLDETVWKTAAINMQ